MSAWRQRMAERLRQLARPRAPEPLPVAIGRRRVYVLPTRFGLFFAVLLLAMLLGALNYNNNPALLLALLLGATAMASMIVAHLQLSGLQVQALSAEPVPAGQAIVLHLALSAADPRPRRGLRVETGPAHAYLPAWRDSTVAILELPTQRRGWLPRQRIRLSSTQPLGLALAWAWVWPDSALLVYPAAEPQGPPLPSGQGQAERSRLSPAGEDVHHLRGYRAGDPRRAIAWKPSARRDTLLVREYEQPLGQDIVLDWASLSSLPYEKRIARLAHWVELAERESRSYRLTLPAQPPLGPSLGAAHRHACLRALALLPQAEAE
ncbi:DUF58 domain-containing protein [Pseudoxanthomonas kalamensis]|uniref:DUF58 domain-containing protein n=1 Tax=Pseudoxanthomonas kalamensis TaxID=289483 RepID=UPI003CCDDDA3